MPADPPEVTDELATLGEIGGGSVVVDVTAPPYNAVGDGVADDTEAINAAILDVASGNGPPIHDHLGVGGIVYLPVGSYRITESLILGWPQIYRRYKFMGAHWANVFEDDQSFGSRILWDGPDDDPILDCQSLNGVTISDLHIESLTDTYTGDMVSLHPGHGDSSAWQIRNLSFGDHSPRTARSNIHLHNAIIGEISNCHCAGAEQGIRLENSAYAVTINIRKCTFNFLSDCDIFVGSPNGEQITIEQCTFEASTVAIQGGTPAHGDTNNNLLWTINILDNWFGDNEFDITWIKGLRVLGAGMGIIQGNKFGSAGGSGTYLDLDAGAGPWLIVGNYFETAGTGTDLIINPGSAEYTLISNRKATTIAPWFDAAPSSLVAIGNKPGLADSHNVSNIFTLGQRQNTNNTDWTMNPNATTVFGESTTTYPTMSQPGLLMWYLISGAEAGYNVDFNTTARFKVAGSERVRLNSTGIGFNNTTPIAKPTVSGSRGGNAALASLLTALANYGLITDSSTA